MSYPNLGSNRVRLFLAALVAALPLFGVAAASAQEAPGSGQLPAVTLTFTPVEVLDPGQEWVDDQGIYHLRGNVNREEVTGDIEGIATTTFNDDAVTTGECTEQGCEGTFMQWIEAQIETEAGRWTGRATFTMSSGGDGAQTSVRAIFIGHGEHAGEAIVVDEFVGFGENGEVTVAGHLLSAAGPVGGIHLRYDLCFTGEGSAAGGFMLDGPVADSGAASASFALVGAPGPGALYGDITFSGERGELYGSFVEFAIEGTSHNVGTFVLLGGTGEYAGLYGYGKALETVSFEGGACPGVSGHWLGAGYGG